MGSVRVAMGKQSGKGVGGQAARGSFCSAAAAAERHAQLAQQFTRFVVVLPSGHDADVESQAALDLVEFDLREDRMVLDPERVVPAAVKRTRRCTPRKSRMTGIASLIRRSRNSYMLRPRSVTFTPIGSPARSLKFEMAIFERVTTGR